MTRFKLGRPGNPFGFGKSLERLPADAIAHLPRKKDGGINAFGLGLAAAQAHRSRDRVRRLDCGDCWRKGELSYVSHSCDVVCELRCSVFGELHRDLRELQTHLRELQSVLRIVHRDLRGLQSHLRNLHRPLRRLQRGLRRVQSGLRSMQSALRRLQSESGGPWPENCVCEDWFLTLRRKSLGQERNQAG
jgi:hypothetical protein